MLTQPSGCKSSGEAFGTGPSVPWVESLGGMRFRGFTQQVNESHYSKCQVASHLHRSSFPDMSYVNSSPANASKQSIPKQSAKFPSTKLRKYYVCPKTSFTNLFLRPTEINHS